MAKIDLKDQIIQAINYTIDAIFLEKETIFEIDCNHKWQITVDDLKINLKGYHNIPNILGYGFPQKIIMFKRDEICFIKIAEVEENLMMYYADIESYIEDTDYSLQYFYDGEKILSTAPAWAYKHLDSIELTSNHSFMVKV